MVSVRDKTLPAISRFWMQVNKTSKGCWYWIGGTRGKPAYGVLQVNGKTVKAHRYSYHKFVGAVSSTDNVCHTCDNTLCVNPEHLFVGTQQDNMTDMVIKGRSNKGEDRPAAKLTEKAVLFIRRNYRAGHYKLGASALAIKFGVNYYTVMSVITGKSWRHVNETT